MGSNLNGRLGLGDKTITHSPVPSLIESLIDHKATAISCGWSHNALVTRNPYWY